jgi:ParB family chromosome partitioning protein
VGKDRSTVANSLRLLKLPAHVRAMVEDGSLSMGHARALLGLDAPAEIETAARRVAARGLSVRATEQLVRAKSRAAAPARPAGPSAKTPAVRDLESRLTKALGAQVAIAQDGKGSGGTISIRYLDLDDLDRLLELLLR